MKNLKELDLEGKRVIVRVDFNVPLNEEGQITDDTRMQKAVPTIKYLLEKGASIVLMSHLGRPQKDTNEDGTIKREKYSLSHLVDHLMELTGVRVLFAGDKEGGELEAMVDKLEAGQIMMLENTRFHAGESKGDEVLAQLWSRLGDVYVNDAFGTAHRKHASTATIATFFKEDQKALGLLMQSEIDNAEKVLMNPKRPQVAIIGGAKVSDKIKLLSRIVEVANMVIIGGGMAYTFIKAQGGDIGNSLCEEDYLDHAREVLKTAKELGTEIYLPKDSVIAPSFSNDVESKVCPSDQIPDGWMGLDIGTEAIEEFAEVIIGGKTILWNGPLGVFEMENFAKGTLSMAKAVAIATEKGAFSLIGGGDSVAAVNKAGLADAVSFISTGGGAMLEYLEGKKLPGIAAMDIHPLEKKENA